MIPEERLEEIREYARRSLNPLFFFDDDPDGLSSFLLFMRTYQKGHGVYVNANPQNEEVYHLKIKENNPDVVFFFDKPLLSQELLDRLAVPAVWIDHHPPQERTNVHYYNPLNHDPKDNRPTTWWAYQVTKGEKWIAMVGCIADRFIPDPGFFKDFPYKKLSNRKKDIEGLLFESPWGTLVKVFSFILKGKSKDVEKNINALIEIKSPEEILNQTSENGKMLYNHFMKINRDFEILKSEALATPLEDGFLVFTYPSTKNSLTGPLSNELQHLLPKKTIIVAREKNGEYRLSMRNSAKDILPAIKKALKGVAGYGGGHPRACGGVISREDFPTFIKNFKHEMAAAK